MSVDGDVSICVDVEEASFSSFCLCFSLTLNFGLSTDIVALFLGRGVLTRWGIFGLCDGRYLLTFLSLNPGTSLWSFAIFNIASMCDNLYTKVRRLYICSISWYALSACGYNFWNSNERSSYVLVFRLEPVIPFLLPYSCVLAGISQCCSQARLYRIWLWH